MITMRYFLFRKKNITIGIYDLGYRRRKGFYLGKIDGHKYEYKWTWYDRTQEGHGLMYLVEDYPKSLSGRYWDEDNDTGDVIYEYIDNQMPLWLSEIDFDKLWKSIIIIKELNIKPFTRDGVELYLLKEIWDKLEPDLQDALCLAWNQAKRDGVNRIKTRYFFSAIAKLAPETLSQLIRMLPKNTLPEPTSEMLTGELSILDESPELSACVIDSLTHLSQKATKNNKVSSVDMFVDIAKYGTGGSVKRLRKYGITPEKIDEIVEQLGWKIMER